MIYSASRRTDLPAFYPDYIVDKIQRSRKLDGVVYWTKDLRNFTKHFGLETVLRNFPSVLQYTVTGLAGSVWEPDVPHYSLQGRSLESLNLVLPKGAIRWRFDPIIADKTLYNRFRDVLNYFVDSGVELDGVTVSFIDMYKKVNERISRAGVSIPTLSLQQRKEILCELHAISGIEIRLCCEADLLDLPFATQSHCIEGALFDKLYGLKLDLRRDTGQRVECGCSLSTDIGSYDKKCLHNCLYCYASSEI